MDNRLTHLDLVRGLAAIAVCAGHLRAFLFVDWQQIKGKVTGLDYLFYFFTSLGHQAVIVFFVMSGFLVGGSIASAWAKGTWSVKGYAFRRIARLETVLLPALLLTVFWDNLGNILTNGVGYDGSLYQFANSGPSTDKPLANGFIPLLGNVTFLMTIEVPVYGTNSPVWSLANEFWYYVIFPLAWISFFRSGMQRFLCSVTVAAIVMWLPNAIVLSGTIWLFGYGAWYACTKSNFNMLSKHPLWLATTSLLFLLALYGSKTAYWFGTDFAIGVAAALFVTALAVRHGNGRSLYGKIAKKLADMSYTLYLFHFPFLTFVWFYCFAPKQFQPDPSGYSFVVFVLSITLAYAYGMWWCFERNTDNVRKYLERGLAGM